MIYSHSLAELMLAADGMLLNLVLVPTLLNKDSAVPLSTSGTFSLLLVNNMVAYLSLGLWFPFGSTFLGVLLWGAIAFLRRPDPDENVEGDIERLVRVTKRAVIEVSDYFRQ